VGLGIVVLVVTLNVLQPLLHLADPNEQYYSDVLARPDLSHLFGTDALGRDVFSRTIAAARVDLLAAGLVTLVSGVVGVLAGAAAGYFGGRLDAVIMRVSDVILSVPVLVFVLAVIAIVGPGLAGFVIAIPLVSWAPYARVTRAEMLVVREKDYINAARSLGYSQKRILLRHALPNVWRSSIVFSMSDLIGIVMLLAALSFLGLGVQPPRAEWGAIIADGQSTLTTAWWVSTLPGFFVVVVGIGLSMIGDGLSEMVGSSV
jgi:peptide/nickel transport system permease protein